MAKVRAQLDENGSVSRRRRVGVWEQVEPRSDWAGVDATTEADVELPRNTARQLFPVIRSSKTDLRRGQE
jgi:hypothetical protein